MKKKNLIIPQYLMVVLYDKIMQNCHLKYPKMGKDNLPKNCGNI